MVDAKYAEMSRHGYASYHEPFVALVGMYFVMIDDSEGNIVLFSAD